MPIFGGAAGAAAASAGAAAANRAVQQNSGTPAWLQSIWSAATGTFKTIADIELGQFELELAKEQRREREQEQAEQSARRNEFFGNGLPQIDGQTALIAGAAVIGLILLLRN